VVADYYEKSGLQKDPRCARLQPWSGFGCTTCIGQFRARCRRNSSGDSKHRIGAAGGAAEADQVEAERIEILLQARFLVVVGDTWEPGASEVSPRASPLSPLATALRASRPAATMTLGFEVLVQA